MSLPFFKSISGQVYQVLAIAEKESILLWVVCTYSEVSLLL